MDKKGDGAGAAQVGDLLLVEILAREIRHHREQAPAAQLQVLAERGQAEIVRREFRALMLEHQGIAGAIIRVIPGSICLSCVPAAPPPHA